MINTFIHSHNSLENHNHFQTKMVQKTCPLRWHIPGMTDLRPRPPDLKPRKLRHPPLPDPFPRMHQIWKTKAQKTQTTPLPNLENSDPPLPKTKELRPANFDFSTEQRYPPFGQMAGASIISYKGNGTFDALFIF